MQSWVYIMASYHWTLYIGVTSELEQRVWQHKSKFLRGFSSKNNCSRLVYFEEFAGIENAIAREKQLKGWVRAKKLSLIHRENPKLDGLAADWFSEADIEAALLENTRKPSS